MSAPRPPCRIPDAPAAPPVVCVTGVSGSGKTTLVVALIEALRARGVRVAALKHASHGFDMDRPGKDSWRMRRAGAREVAVVGNGEVALIADADALGGGGRDPDPVALATRLFAGVDLVLAEGFSFSDAPRIEVVSGPAKRDKVGAGPLLATVVRDLPASVVRRLARSGPVFGADRADSLAGFLLEHLQDRGRGVSAAASARRRVGRGTRGDAAPPPSGRRA